MYINEQINKQKKYKQKTITCNRPIHIAHYSPSHLGLCRKHFAIDLSLSFEDYNISNRNWFCGFVFVHLAI